MQFDYIILEGADCSGKTTLYEALHKATNYKYNIHDRSNLSMYIYSTLYNRNDSSKWYKEFWKEVFQFNTLNVILLPEDSVLEERYNNRGDDKQSFESILKINKKYHDLCNFHFRNMFVNILPVKISKETSTDDIVHQIKSRIDTFDLSNPADLIKSAVFASGNNEVTNVSVRDLVFSPDKKFKDIVWDALNYPPEAQYYENIRLDINRLIDKELMGLNEYSVPQKIDSRRFIYTSNTCISFIHALYRNNELDVKVILRSSNVSKTLWADYEFLKIVCLDIAKKLDVNCDVYLSLEIRSAHINP